MKPVHVLCIMLYCTTNIVHCNLVNYYSIRSQGANQPRHLSGTIDQIYPFNNQGVTGTFSITPEYTHSFNAKQITRSLFGDQLDAQDRLVISGSRVPNRGIHDWLADYFYLPTDFQSTVSFNPSIENIIIDINLFVTLNCWCQGLYLNLFAPFVYSRWDLNICEHIINPGVNTYPAGYFTPDVTPRNELNNSFTDYANGISKSPVDQTITGTQFSVVFQPLANAQMSNRRRATSRLADIRAQLGWMFIDCIEQEASIYAHASFPTGNRPEAKLLFEPMTGNGHHWELGVGMYGRYRLWSNNDETTSFDIQADAYYAHQFNARQKRTFDLINGPASRYMLAERLNTFVSNGLVAGSSPATAQAPSEQFQSDFNPVANLSTIGVDVNSKATGEITFIGIWRSCGWSINAGYNLWLRSCESLGVRGGINLLENNTMWALKGDAHVFGFLATDDLPLTHNFPVALSATEQNASIHSGLNFPPGTTDFIAGEKNPNIDNPAPAFAGTSVTPLLYQPGVANISSNQINTSLPPKLLTANMLDICNARTSALSHTIFMHIAYTWQCDDWWQPYLGVGGQAEFGQADSGCNNRCVSCVRCPLSQWGVWFKGGVSF